MFSSILKYLRPIYYGMEMRRLIFTELNISKFSSILTRVFIYFFEGVAGGM